MSSHKINGSGSTGGDHGRDQPARPSPVDRDWEDLRATIRDLIRDDDNTEVQEALSRYHRLHIPVNQRPSEGTVINRVAQLVDLANGRISPQEAILRMAGVRFDYQVAANAYLDEPVDGPSSACPSPRDGQSAGDQDEVEGQGEGDQGMSDDAEDEPESSSGEDDATAVLRRCLAANPGIDRSAAKRGRPDQSKLTITIRQPDGRPNKVSRYRGKVDFRKSVRDLNKWRAQVFRRNFGGSRPFRQHFHPLEKEWLLEEHTRFEGSRLAQGKPVDYSTMRWVDIAERFNRRFEGRYLPGVKTPRPARTAVALRTERNRLREITDPTGLRSAVTPRLEASNQTRTAPAKVDSEEEGSSSPKGEDDDSEDGWGGMDPRGTRRGDSPPGIKPWRKDDMDRGGGGCCFLTVNPIERG
ncbi:hypothetical protein MMC07_007754 [Pseudocyphellaria aurata]|nr:hypothetical protein [Pseudocyphellaria aurata]